MATRSVLARERSHDTPRYQPLVSVAAAFCFGIVADRYTQLPWPSTWWLAAALLLLWWTAWRFHRDRIAAACLLACVAATGATWHQVRWHLFSAQELGRFAVEESRPIALEAEIASAPRWLPVSEPDPLAGFSGGPRSTVALQVTKVRDVDRWISSAGRTIVEVDGYLPELEIGDQVRVYAQLSAYPRPMNPGGFDVASYQRGSRQLARLRTESPECVIRTMPAQSWSLARVVDSTRRRGELALQNQLQPAQQAVAAALLLGMREQMDQQSTDQYVQTGTVHVLSISGLHVSMLVGLFFLALRAGLLPQSIALAAASLLAIGYALLTGAEPPIVRAAVLVIIVCGGMYGGRRPRAFNSLAAAAILVLVLNPADLFRTGTQLSFLCMATLVIAAPLTRPRLSSDPLERLVATTRPWHQRVVRRGVAWVICGLLVSAAIWFVTLPLVMARFHIVSPVALVLNLLLWGPVFAAMASGFGLLVGGSLSSALAVFCGKVCNTSLSWMDAIVQQGDALPFSHFWVSGPQTWWLIGFYLALALWLAMPRWRPAPRWCVALVAGWTAIGLGVAMWPAGERPLRCTFLSVGHGSAVVLQLPDGRTLLYDAGQLGSPSGAARSVSGFLWSRGITHLDAVVISHADVDHFNGLPELARQFSMGVVYVSPRMFLDQADAVLRLNAALSTAGIRVREMWAGDRIRAGAGTSIVVRHPTREGVIGSDNANSIVLAVEHQGCRLLLTGDLEDAGLEAVMAEEPYDCDVLLAPHHGSARSDPPGFARWSTPEWVVMSSAARFARPEVAAAYRARGSRVLQTFRDGAIEIQLAGSRQISVETFRPAVDETAD